MTPFRYLALLPILLATGTQVAAMSEKDAAGNMMYFAFAMKEGELCEKLGFPAMPTLRTWEKKNADLLTKSMRKVEDWAASAKNLPRAEAKDVALGLFIKHKQTFDREMAPLKSQKSCLAFADTLRLYDGKLVTE